MTKGKIIEKFFPEFFSNTHIRKIGPPLGKWWKFFPGIYLTNCALLKSVKNSPWGRGLHRWGRSGGPPCGILPTMFHVKHLKGEQPIGHPPNVKNFSSLDKRGHFVNGIKLDLSDAFFRKVETLGESIGWLLGATNTEETANNALLALRKAV